MPAHQQQQQQQQQQNEERRGLSPEDNQALPQQNTGLLGEVQEAAAATPSAATSAGRVQYGASNESGQLLAQELLIRELQARELLAREMGSHQTESRKRSATARSTRSWAGTYGGNVSLDGSSIVTRKSSSRWETWMMMTEPSAVAAAAAVARRENSSLPAEFLYFKYEQMVARWIQQKMMSTVLSLERYGPNMVLNHTMAREGPRHEHGPPRTITTTTNTTTIPVAPTNNNRPKETPDSRTATPALETIPSHLSSVPSTEDPNVPRFMRNTTTSVGHSVRADRLTPPRTSNQNRSRPRSRTPSKSPGTHHQNSHPPTRDRQKTRPEVVSSPPRPRNRSTRTRTGPNSRQITEPQWQETRGSTSNKKKREGASRSQSTPVSLQQRQQQRQQEQEETRSPLETMEDHDAQHYFKRESSAAPFVSREEHHPEQDYVSNDTHGPLHYQTTATTEPSKPDTIGPTPHTRPDPEGCSKAMVTSPNPMNREQLRISLPPSPSPANRTNRFASPTAAAKAHQVAATAGKIMGSPSSSRAKKTSPSKNAVDARKATSSRSPTQRRASPSPRRVTQTPKARNSTSTPTTSNGRRRKSRLPPLPSFRDGPAARSPSPQKQQRQQKQQTGSSPRKASTLPAGNTKRQSLSPKGKKGPPRAGKRATTKPDPPKLRQYKRVHFRAIRVLQRFGRTVPDRRRFLRLRSSVVILQSMLRQKLQIRAFRRAIKGTRLQKFASTVIQRNFRMVACQSSYAQLRYAVIVVQSVIRMFACRSTFQELRSASRKLLGRCPIREAPTTPKPQVATIKGGRLRIYSALLIQSVVRMRWVRAAFLELRSSAFVLQKWFRKVHQVIRKQNAAAVVIQNWSQTLTWRACFLELRGSVLLLQKWTRQVLARSRHIREKRYNLERSAAFLIQLHWRGAVCRSAYNQLRSSCLVLQQWTRSRAQHKRLCHAAVIIQCRLRQLRSTREVSTRKSGILVTTAFWSYGSTIHVPVTTIQAYVRGYLYRTRYLSLSLAAIVAQKRFRGKQSRAYVAVRRAALFKETTKQKRSKMNEVIEKPKPDPVDRNTMDASLLGAPQPGDTLKLFGPRVSHDGGILSVALANVAQSPALRSTTPRRFRQASPSMNGNGKSFFPRSVPINRNEKPIRAPSPETRTQTKEIKAIEAHNPFESFPRDLHDSPSTKVAAAMSTTIVEKRTQRSYPRDPAGENMSRQPPPSSMTHYSSSTRGEYSEPKPSTALYTSPPPPPPPPPPRPRHAKQPKIKTVNGDTKTAGIQSLKSDPPNIRVLEQKDVIDRIPRHEMSPSDHNFCLMSRSSDEESAESDSFVEKFAQNVNPKLNSYLYLAQPSHVPDQLRDKGTIMNRLGPFLLDNLLDFEPVPSISDHPRYYLPKPAKAIPKSKNKKNSLALEQSPHRLESSQESADRAAAPLPTTNPLKKMLKSRHNDESVTPKLTMGEDTIGGSISAKTATAKHRSSRSRKVLRSRSATRKKKAISSIDLKGKTNKYKVIDEVVKTEQTVSQSKAKGPSIAETKDTSTANPMEKWAKETLEKRKNSLFTSVLDDESATLIQAVWRSRRDQLRLAALLLKTWSVSCEFQSDVPGNDGMTRQNAHILALDGAFKQVGYDWQDCNLLIKQGLTMLQWEGLIPIGFSKLGISEHSTFYTRVRVHCTGGESNLLRAWNEDRRCVLLAKAAITKHCSDHKECASVFEKSLSSKSSENGSFSDPVPSAQQLTTDVGLRNGSPWTDPPDVEDPSTGEEDDALAEFQGRIFSLASILIQSWYRMCVCRRMYRGLRRIQSRAEATCFDSHRPTTCETIVEEKEGFEVNSSSAEEE